VPVELGVAERFDVECVNERNGAGAATTGESSEVLAHDMASRLKV